MHASLEGRARALLLIPTLALATGAADDAAPAARTPEALAAFLREHSPRARALSLERKAARRAAEGAGSFFDPMIEARVAPLSVPGLLPEDPHNPMPFGVEVMVAQRLPLSGRLARERERATALGERVRHLTDGMELDLELDVAMLACEAWQRAESTRVHERHLEVLRTIAELTRAQLAGARASVGDAQQVDAEIAMVEAELAELAGMARAVDARTNALLGRAAEAPLPAPPAEVPWLSTDPPSLDVEARTEVRAQAALVQAGQAERARAADAWIPDLTAQASWSSMWPLSHQFLLGVGVEIPLFNRGRSAELDSADLMRDGAQASLDEVRARAQAELGAAQARDRAAAAALAILRERVVPLAVARAETTRASVGGGASFDAALEATRDEIEARLQEARVAAERCQSRAELWRAAGVSFLPDSSTEVQP